MLILQGQVHAHNTGTGSCSYYRDRFMLIIQLLFSIMVKETQRLVRNTKYEILFSTENPHGPWPNNITKYRQ